MDANSGGAIYEHHDAIPLPANVVSNGTSHNDMNGGQYYNNSAQYYNPPYNNNNTQEDRHRYPSQTSYYDESTQKFVVDNSPPLSISSNPSRLSPPGKKNPPRHQPTTAPSGTDSTTMPPSNNTPPSPDLSPHTSTSQFTPQPSAALTTTTPQGIYPFNQYGSSSSYCERRAVPSPPASYHWMRKDNHSAG